MDPCRKRAVTPRVQNVLWTRRFMTLDSREKNFIVHDSDLTWASGCIKSPAIRLFLQQLTRSNNREASKLHITGPSSGKLPGEFPSQRASCAKKRFHVITPLWFAKISWYRENSIHHHWTSLQKQLLSCEIATQKVTASHWKFHSSQK